MSKHSRTVAVMLRDPDTHEDMIETVAAYPDHESIPRQGETFDLQYNTYFVTSRHHESTESMILYVKKI